MVKSSKMIVRRQASILRHIRGLVLVPRGNQAGYVPVMWNSQLPDYVWAVFGQHFKINANVLSQGCLDLLFPWLFWWPH